MNCTVACRECDRSCKRTLAHDRPGSGEDASGLRAGLDGLGRRVRTAADPFDAGGRIADWLAAQASDERRGLPLVPPLLLW